MNDMQDSLRELYQEVIFDHNRNPRNYRPLPAASHHADGHNPLCGDQLTVYVQVEDGIVREASFVGHGCAISTASASLMTEAVKGKPIEDVEALFRDVHALLTEGREAEAVEIAQPWPTKLASRTRPSSTCRYTVSWSPQSGLWPSAWWLAAGSGR